MNLAHVINDGLAQTPDKVLFDGDGRQFTYAEVARLSENFGASLAALGYGLNARIAVVLPNIPEYGLAIYGIWRIGAEPVLINPQLTAPELAYILQDALAEAILLPDALLPVFETLRSQLPKLKVIVVGAEVTVGDLSFATLVSTPGNCEIVERAPDDIAQIMYTSGTTGQPKGALVSHNNLFSNAKAGIEFLSVTNNDHFFALLPVFHAFAFNGAFVLFPLAGGSTSFEYRYTPKKLIAQLSDPRYTVMAAVPSLLSTLMRLPEAFKLSPNMRCILSGGGALAPALEQEFTARFGSIVRQGYGMTECCPYAGCTPLHGPVKFGSVGVPFPQGHELRVRDPLSGEFLGNGKVGELVVRGPHVFKGYWNKPQATADTFVDGWLRTGDLGYRDDDGYYFIVDRLKDMLIVGGEKVFSREVEDVLMTFPAIREVAIIGDLDLDKGELVHAYVSFKEGASATEAEIIAFARTQLTAVKVPKKVTILEDLPKSALGKILKRELRKMVVAI
jgi:long-chain acyl-CoA synthetase